MKSRMLVIAAVAGSLLGAVGQTPAQSHSGEAHGRGHSGGGSGGGGGWGGGYGGGILPGLDAQQATGMQVKGQGTLAGQQAAAAQDYMLQSGIRKTLSSAAQRRADAILGQQQATQDWLLQQQAQQREQRRTAAAEKGTRGDTPPSGPPPAAMDIIKWPALLQERGFASERAKIEAPYRRSPSKPSAPWRPTTVRWPRPSRT